MHATSQQARQPRNPFEQLPAGSDAGGQIEIKCSRCGTPLWIEAAYAAWASATACDKCCAAYDAQQAREVRQEATGQLKQIWEDICPPAYQAKIDLHKHPNFNAEAYHRAMAWELASKRGLFLIGASGSGKTRTMWRLVAREIAAYRSVKIFSGQAFAHEAADAAREGRERAWHRELGREVDLLCIDDLGNHKFTPTLEASLFDVIENRMAYLKPIVITSNYSAEDFVSTESGSLFHNTRLAAATVRRLVEFCSTSGIINFNKPSQTSLL